MLVRFLRKRRWLFVLATVAALAVQLPLTIAALPRLGTARYVSEVASGISRAFVEAWRG